MRPALSAVVAALLVPLALLATPAAACGTAEGVCEVAGGRYRLVLPEAMPEGGHVPAVFYLHGWGASARGALTNERRLGVARARGYALVVPLGVARPGRSQRDWAVRDGRDHPRDDLAFFGAVLEDAAARGVDRDRVLLGGFSRGGSMVWEVACHAPALFRAYAPLAGAFWEPLPEGCAGPADLFHTHGWSDTVVPIEGRSIGGGRIVQGDAFAALAILREANGCAGRAQDAAEAAPGLWIRRWTGCADGRVALMLHPGGHTEPEGWMGRMLDWLEARLAEGAAGR